MGKSRLFVALSLPLFASIACSSSSSPATAPASGDDAGTAPAGDDAGPPVDAAPPIDASEPAWSGQTIEPGCTSNGCIHAFAKTAGYTKAIIQANAAQGQTVSNGIKIWGITYMSDGVETTGSVYVPDSAPPAAGFPVVVMNQFTSGVAPPCDPSAGELGIGVASATALRGILTIVPDAPSYGGGKLGVYMAAPPAGRAALDAARAAFHVGPALGLSVQRVAVIAGLSEGAHSTMAAAAEMPTYAPNLEIKGFAAVAPPANLRSGTNKVFTDDANFTWYIAARMQTWQQHYNLSGGEIFKDPYASNVESWLETECLYDGSSGTYDSKLETQFADKPSAIIADSFLAYGKTDSWPADWGAVFAAATPMPVGNKLPIVVWQGSADTTVPKADTDTYMGQLQAAGVTVDYRVVNGSEHTTTALSSFTVVQAASDDAYTWISQHLGM
jgi:acetyl esterase/lipase